MGAPFRVDDEYPELDCTAGQNSSVCGEAGSAVR
jgi:hypothetical protein